MKLNLTTIFTARFWALLASIMLLTMMSACGGGNGSAGTPIGGSGSGSGTGTGTGTGTGGTKSTNGSISVALSNGGTATNVIPSAGTLTVSATVLTSAGAAAPENTLVNFSINSSSGVLPVTSALTNSSGVATVSLLPGSVSGAGTVTATVTLSGATAAITGSANFTYTAVATTTTNGSISIALVNPATTLQTFTIPTGGTLTATATVLNPNGSAVTTGTLVTFSVNGTAGALPVTTALTDANGHASVTLQQGSSSGAGTLTASAVIGNATVTGSSNFQTIIAQPSANPLGLVTVTLENGTTPANTIPTGGSLNVVANVVNGSGAPVPIYTLVKFGVSNSDGALPVISALTNVSGSATVTLQPGTTLGAGTVTASAPIGTNTITGSANFQSNSTGVTPTTGGQMSLTLTNSSNVSTNTIPVGGTLNVTATLTNASGTAIPNTVVSFATSNGTGSLLVNTALTNSAGVAVIGLQSGSQAGAGTVTATATVAGVLVTQSISYQTGAGSGTPSITVTLTNSSGCSVNTVSPSCPLVANARVVDANGNGVSNVLVNFGDTLSGTGLAPSSGTVLTGSSGVATAVISTTSLPTSAQNGSAGTINVSATVSGVTVANAANFSLGTVPTSLKLITPTPVTGTTSGAVTVPAYGSTTITVEVDVYDSTTQTYVPYTAQPVTVTFTSTCQISGKATLASSATTASNGQATVTYTDLGCAQVDTVTASGAGAQSPVTIAVTDTVPQAQNINFISATPSDESIVLPGTGGAGRTSTAILTFEVVDQNGNPLGGQSVSFAINKLTGTGTVATISSPSPATTSTTSGTVGQVQVAATAVSAGTFAVVASASVPCTSPCTPATITATSNSVVVSTGQPVQASFTIAPTTLNIEGWNYAGTTDNITAFIADANGNPVVNGTPVSATTNEGSVGNASGLSGGCTTTNGQCSVVFTSQNPLSVTTGTACTALGYATPPCAFGIATVSFTSSNQTTSDLSGSTQVYMSGSYPYAFFDQYTIPTPLVSPGDGGTSATTYVPDGTALYTTNCSPYITLYFADVNGNPMPAGTTFAVSTTTTGLTIGSVSPSAVTNYGVGAGTLIAPQSPATTIPGGFTPNNGVVNAQALTINYTVAAPLSACSATPANGGTGALVSGNPAKITGQTFNFSVQTTTPKGVQKLLNYSFTYPK